MPCDTQYQHDNMHLFNDVSCEIEALNNVHNDMDCIIVGGDFHTDLRRDVSLHTQALVNFCVSNSLKLCERSGTSKADYTYMSASEDSTSLIDHFIVSDNAANHVVGYYCLHDGHNLTDHDPLRLRLDFKNCHVKMNPRSFQAKPKWSRAESRHLTKYQLIKWTE